jgi:hypothetical protein
VCYLYIMLLLWWREHVKCGGETRQEVNNINVSVLEGTVEKQWNSGMVIFLLLGLCCSWCLHHSLSPRHYIHVQYLVRLVYLLMVHRYIVHCYDIETIRVHQSVWHGALLCFSVTVFVRHAVCCGPLLGLSILCAVMDCTLVITYSAALICCQ